MNQDLINGSRTLEKGRIRHVHAEKGRRVECLAGWIWITQDGDLRDIVLGAGEAFDFDRRGDALLSALADSRYLVLSETEDLARRPGSLLSPQVYGAY